MSDLVAPLRLEKLAGLLASLGLLTPLVVVPWLVFPFVAPKVYWLRGLVALLAAAHVVLIAACRRRYLPPRSALAATALFLGSAGLSTVLGVDVHRSLWGSHERMLGLVTLLYYGALFLALAGIGRDAFWWRRLWSVACLAGGAAMGLAVLQKLRPGLLWSDDARVAGTLGHPSYLGGLGTWLVFAAGIAHAAGTRRALVLAVVPLGLLGVLLGETRGSLLAVAAGAATLALWQVSLRTRGRGLRRRWVVLAVALLVLGLAAAALYQSSLLRELPGLRRFSALTLSQGSSATRLLFWQAALEAWQERPLLGWGPANFYHAFNVHYPAAMLDHGRGETWVDQAHNVFLEALVTRGALGLGALLGLYGAALGLAVRAHRRGRLGKGAAGCAIALLVSQLVHLSFGLEEPTSWLCFVLLAGYLVHVSRSPAPEPAEAARSPSNRRRVGWLAAAAAAAAVALVVWIDVRPALADWHWHRSSRALAAIQHRAARLADALGPLALALAEQEAAAQRVLGRLAADLERAATRYRFGADLGSPHRDWASEALTEYLVAAAPAVERLGSRAPRFEARLEVLLGPLCELAWRELAAAAALHPRDVRLAIRQVKLGGVILSITGDASRLAAAAACLAAMRRYSPRRQEILSELIAANERLGEPARVAEAQAVLRCIEAERTK